jgi:hypothetical protein
MRTVGVHPVESAAVSRRTPTADVQFGIGLTPPSQHAHHGIRYSLTLHDKCGTRVLGYDNAHAVMPPKKFKFAGQRLPYDHRHRTSSDKGVSYAFESAQRLL